MVSSSLSRVTLMARVAPIFCARPRPVVVHVGDDHVARADALGDGDRHDADGPAPVIEHVFAHHVEGEGGVRGVAERIEDARDVVGDRIGELERVARGDAQVLGEAALAGPRPRRRCCDTGGGARRGSCGSSRR